MVSESLVHGGLGRTPWSQKHVHLHDRQEAENENWIGGQV
jgi:hypothetical protein